MLAGNVYSDRTDRHSSRRFRTKFNPIFADHPHAARHLCVIDWLGWWFWWSLSGIFWWTLRKWLSIGPVFSVSHLVKLALEIVDDGSVAFMGDLQVLYFALVE